MYALPPEITVVDIDKIIESMTEEDIAMFKEFRMMHFSSWLSELIKAESKKSGETFEEFVRTACRNELIYRIQKRHPYVK